MTSYYYCTNCKKLLGVTEKGKVGVCEYKLLGECCYDMQLVLDGENKSRTQRGLQKEKLQKCVIDAIHAEEKKE